MCDGHLLLSYYSEITSGVDPIHILHPWSEGLFIREVVPGLLSILHPLSKIVIHTSVQYGCAEVWMTILESGWNLWVWLVGVVSRRWVWLVGGIYGYGYHV